MAITNEPIEGKIVVLKGSSTEVFEWPREGGVITKVSGQRVYYTDADGKEKYTHAVCAVCDTKVEAARFLAFTTRNLERLGAFVDLCRAEEHALWEPGGSHVIEEALDKLKALLVTGKAEEDGGQARARAPKPASTSAKPTKTGKGKAAAQPNEATMQALASLKEAMDDAVAPVNAVRRTRRVRPA